jgi:hypothetical protein
MEPLKRGRGRPSLYRKELSRDGLTPEQERLLRKEAANFGCSRNALFRAAIGNFLETLGYSDADQGMTKAKEEIASFLSMA